VALRGFERIHLDAGTSQKVHFDLKPRDLGMVTEDGNPVIAQGGPRNMNFSIKFTF